MGQIHLFAPDMSPIMRDFLVEYRDGALHPVAFARVLDDNPYPHAQMVVADLPYNYLLAEFSDPLDWRDLNWLMSAIILGKFAFDRTNAKAYAIARALKRDPNAGPYHVSSDEEWARITRFRRLLELPALALKMLKATYSEGEHLVVKRLDCETLDGKAQGRVMMIEYAGDIVPEHVSQA